MLTGKKSEIKRNHHYVWADYLKRWSSDQKSVWHTTPTGKVSFNSVRSISKEDFFYKAQPLLPEHLLAINLWSTQSPKHLQEEHVNFLEMFMRIEALRHRPDSGKLESEVERVSEVLRCNLLEDRHAIHEREARPVMSALANGNFDFLNEGNNLIIFLAYFGHQISRTKAFKDTFKTSTRMFRQEGNEAELFAEATEQCWWFISYMFGINIGWSLYSTRSSDNHCLLINKTDTDFITSDQPIVNVHPDLKEGTFVAPDDDVCDFFYPISPNVAFMINRSNAFPNGVSDAPKDFVLKANHKIAKFAHTYIIGASEQSVKMYKSLVGSHKKAAEAHYTSIRFPPEEIA